MLYFCVNVLINLIHVLLSINGTFIQVTELTSSRGILTEAGHRSRIKDVEIPLEEKKIKKNIKHAKGTHYAHRGQVNPRRFPGEGLLKRCHWA